MCSLMSFPACSNTHVEGDVHTFDMTQYRKPLYPVNNILVNRWSPYRLVAKPVSKDMLMSLFEAARFAPSSYNEQPWRFIYALRDTAAWNTLLGLLVPQNQAWAQNASALVVIVSKNSFTHNNTPNRVHSFDSGAAWQNIALQASTMGLAAHGIGGFDYEKAHSVLHVPVDYTVEAMIAIGWSAHDGSETPSDRKTIDTFVFEGSFKNS